MIRQQRPGAHAVPQAKIWVHTVATYAGAALVPERYRHIAAQSADNVDGFNFNMHKMACRKH